MTAVDAKNPPSWPRFLAIGVGAAMAAPCLAVSLLALGAPATLAYAGTITVLAFGAIIAHKLLPAEVARVSQGTMWLFVLWGVLSGVAVYRISSLAVFIDNPSRTQYAFQRSFREMDDPELTKPFFLTHNCSTCYLVAAYLADAGKDNIYDKRHYRKAEEKTPIHETIGETFHIDQYQYPPPFLLGPYAAYATGLDFFQLRSLWFAVGVLTLLLTSVALTVWVCGWSFGPLWLMWPAVFVAPTTIGMLQIGNVHVFIVLISILAMLLLERRQNFLGGTLLAYATLSKFFPGLLVVYLLFRKRWDAAAWVAGAGVGLSLAALLLFGVTPYQAFFEHQLPAIASGKAFWFAFEIPHAILENLSIMGLFYKLKIVLGLADWDPKAVAQAAIWIYSAVVIALAALAGWQHRVIDTSGEEHVSNARTRLLQGRVWVALLVLAQLRSPFLPSVYGSTAVIVLFTLMVTIDGLTVFRLLLVSLGVAAFATTLPLAVGPVSSSVDFAFSIGTTIVALGLGIVVALRRLPKLGSPAEV